MNLNNRIENYLKKRKEIGTFRTLKNTSGLIDFCSNDYLGLAQNEDLLNTISNANKKQLGATGSRLITGNYTEIEDLERYLANFFNGESALLFNSGYTANLSIISTLCRKGDFVIFDELIHASLHDGLALSKANKIQFKHNNLQDLEEWLIYANTKIEDESCIFILVESIYSMDGDLCDIKAIVDLTKKYNAYIILDEAHSTGLYENSKGWAIQNRVEDQIFARIYTFGKAIAYDGAIIVGNKKLRNYLINFARPFIYTTAPNKNKVATIKSIFEFLETNTTLVNQLEDRISYFKQKIEPIKPLFSESDTAIQSLVLAGNDKVKYLANFLEKEANIYVKAIVSPTVPKGKERLRICLHAFNTEAEIDLLVYNLQMCLKSAEI